MPFLYFAFFLILCSVWNSENSAPENTMYLCSSSRNNSLPLSGCHKFYHQLWKQEYCTSYLSEQEVWLFFFSFSSVALPAEVYSIERPPLKKEVMTCTSIVPSEWDEIYRIVTLRHSRELLKLPYCLPLINVCICRKPQNNYLFSQTACKLWLVGLSFPTDPG